MGERRMTDTAITKMSASARGSIGKQHFLTEINTGENNLFSDEPAWNGGQGKGMNPFELLASALVACTCATLRMYIDRKQWDVSKIDTTVELERDLKANITCIKRSIQVEGNLSEEQRARLLAIANVCPVHKLLTNPIHIETQLS